MATMWDAERIEGGGVLFSLTYAFCICYIFYLNVSTKQNYFNSEECKTCMSQSFEEKRKKLCFISRKLKSPPPRQNKNTAYY